MVVPFLNSIFGNSENSKITNSSKTQEPQGQNLPTQQQTPPSASAAAATKDFCACADFQYFRTHSPHTSMFPLFVFLRSKLTNTPPPKTKVDSCNQCNKQNCCTTKTSTLAW
jgi:hypothetical protein